MADVLSMILGDDPEAQRIAEEVQAELRARGAKGALLAGAGGKRYAGVGGALMQGAAGEGSQLADAASQRARQSAELRKAILGQLSAIEKGRVDREERARQRALDRASAETRARIMAGQIGTRRAEDRTAREARAIEGDVTKLGKDLEPLAIMGDDIATLEGFAGREDTPGFGPAAGFVPDFMQGREGTQARQAAGRLMANILFMQSGKATTETEVERQLQARGIGPRASVTAFREGVKALAKEAQDAAGRREAWYRPEVRAALEARGGMTSKGFGKRVVERRRKADGTAIVKYADGTFGTE